MEAPLGQAILTIPGIRGPLGARRQGRQQVPRAVVGARCDARAGLAGRQLVTRVVDVRRHGAAIDQQRPVADRVVGVRDIVALGPAPVLVGQLVGGIIRPAHHVPVGLDNLRPVADRVIRVVEAG